MKFTILDCYTDEPAGLGVPPYIGTYARYIAGTVLDSGNDYSYITVDDLRKSVSNKEEKGLKTDIRIKNLSKNFLHIGSILSKTDVLIVIAGIHTPGKYLSAVPGTTKEVVDLLARIKKKFFTILTGPAAYGSGLYGGRIARSAERDLQRFDLIIPEVEYRLKDLIINNFEADVSGIPRYDDLRKIAVLGSEVVKQHPSYPNVIAEIETSRGCPRKIHCSFCTEGLKFCAIEKRKTEDIVDEVKALYKQGVRNFRLGKQSCFYSYGSADEIERLLKGCRKYADILHIDNANPAMVTEEKTKIIVKYCTSGNIAAFGVESFDKNVIKKNHLNSTPEQVYNAVRIINKYGAECGENGMQKFLPGINLLYGLIGESKKTHKENFRCLKKILDDSLLLRRINIRQVAVFPGTLLANECGDKFIKKNKKYYWKWRNSIRQNIDEPMLKRLVPAGTVLKNIFTEIHDGNTTFGRQIGTYPLIVGIKKRIPLGKFIDIRVTGHMLRSVVGELIQ
ncbi:radical SAM protein [Candidatus Woesearchaeota archaeon]|nr:radical SAM protein [Candidatus Woesearchaeota archaeon]